MKSKDEKEFEKIQEAVLVECSISCQKCGKTIKEYDTDDYWMTYNLIQKGWTVKRGKILCEVCSLK